MMPLRGRPPKPDPKWQDCLTIHQAIATGALPAAEDRTRLDRYGKPLLVVTKEAIDTWLNRALLPIQAMPLAM